MYTILFVLSLCSLTVYAQNTTSSPTKIKCRLCTRATALSDCKQFVLCDNTLEDCFMDELITDQLTTVYEGGCRAKDVCSRSGRKKRKDLVACSRCCNAKDDCNKRLCGIKDDTIGTSQCYSCDHQNSEQSEVKKPEDCVTLDTCQHNEVCYATQSDVGGVDTFVYGCLGKLQCSYLMDKAYKDYLQCVKNSTTIPDGLTWAEVCGDNQRSTNLCHSCCADGGCNYGTCQDLNERIFNLADQGKFNFTTLRTM